jgi:hypothetical protein
MTASEIFPAAKDDGCEPFRKIGARLGCDEYLVLDAFRGLGIPEWEISTHLDDVKASTQVLNEAARYADNLLGAMRRLSEDDRRDLIVAGAPTFHQIEFLRDTLQGDASDLKSWASRRNRTGGRNPAAYIVAEGMRKVFRRLRKPITFGNHYEGGPSTEFGKEVEFALGAFGIRADWRRPTQEATEKQGKIAARMFECSRKKQRADFLENPPTSPDLSGIAIKAETVDGRRIYVISLMESPEIPPLRMDIKNVPNGRDEADFALQWATSVRAAKG